MAGRPDESLQVLEKVGDWLSKGGAEAVFDTDLFTFDLRERGAHRGDACRDCPVDITLKDVETVENDPERIKKWVALTREVIDEVFG